MSEETERPVLEFTVEDFWEKWKPENTSAKMKADFIVDLERVILTRMRDLGVLDSEMT
jgi:hypothetical protein